MIDLEHVSGLPIALNDDNTISFKKPLAEVKPAIRTLEEMKPVLLDPASDPGTNDMYYMYRNVHFSEHEQIVKDNKVSYDITVLPHLKIGRELNKTQGHYHTAKEGSSIAYPEVYEVLNGHALFLLQKMDAEFKELRTVVAIEGRTGDKVVYPSNYGHILVNIGKDTLVVSNWVASECGHIYDKIIERKGMAFYIVAGNSGGYDFVPNPNYTNNPEFRKITTDFMKGFEIMGDGPMYSIGTKNPKALEFLTHPAKYAVELSSITS